ncbi:MAG: hypothetical protein IPH52_14180 [Leptospiraceae bacterium]|nr:hypothetical protein [Leptospiraceae bacterium]
MELLPISLLIGCMLTFIVASLNYVTKSDEDQLEALQAKIEKREPLEKYEKEAYCDLLWKVKQIRLCACKKNFIKDIGSVTGYDVQDSDLDWRNSGKTFEEALEEAFRRTGIPKEQFETQTALGTDINTAANGFCGDRKGKSGCRMEGPHKYRCP